MRETGGYLTLRADALGARRISPVEHACEGEQARRLIRALSAITEKRVRRRIVSFVEQVHEGGRDNRRKLEPRS